MSRIGELRLMTRVARMYYERNMRQSEIAHQLGLSQATISRLFNKAREAGIVCISIRPPQGVYTELEEKLIDVYHLRDAIVVDATRDNDEELIHRELGIAAAHYVESMIKKDEVIGISSWSSTLLALVDALHQLPDKSGVKVVQILGGVGNPSAEVHATRLTSRFADLVKGEAIFLPAPGVVGSEAAREVLLNDQYVREAFRLFDEVTMALVGIGSVKPSTLLADSGNIFSDEELEVLGHAGAVGDVLLRFFDANGDPVDTILNQRVVSMSLDQLKNVDKAIGVAGGKRKYPAILGVLRGQWINVLITDRKTAEQLLLEGNNIVLEPQEGES